MEGEDQNNEEEQPQGTPQNEGENQDENDLDDNLELSEDHDVNEEPQYEEQEIKEVPNEEVPKNDYEEENIEEKSHKHRHHHHKHKHHRSHSKHNEENPDEVENSEKTGGKRKKKSSKEPKKLKKVKGDEDLERQADIDREVDVIIKEIEDAASSDIQSRSEGKLASEKICTLPKIKAELKKTQYQESFLSKRGLQALGLWIQRYEDGTRVCFDVLNGIMEICNELPITMDYLYESGRELAHCITDIYKTHDSEQLRVMAKRLIDKWSRQIYGIDAESYNHSDREQGYVQYLKHIKDNFEDKEKQESSEENNKADFEEVKVGTRGVNRTAPPGKKTLASISKMGFDFIKRPESDVIIEKKKEESSVTPLMRKMLQVKRDGKKKPSAGAKYKSAS